MAIDNATITLKVIATITFPANIGWACQLQARFSPLEQTAPCGSHAYRTAQASQPLSSQRQHTSPRQVVPPTPPPAACFRLASDPWKGWKSPAVPACLPTRLTTPSSCALQYAASNPNPHPSPSWELRVAVCRQQPQPSPQPLPTRLMMSLSCALQFAACALRGSADWLDRAFSTACVQCTAVTTSTT